MPLLTIFLITYNHQNYIRQALDSIASQDFSDYEVIVTDNNSQDRTPAILNEYAAKDQRIILHLFSDNVGCYGRYDTVVREARGRYILTLSGDDWFAPGIFQAAVDAAETYQADLVHFGLDFNYFNDRGELINVVHRQAEETIVASSPEEISRKILQIYSHCHIVAETPILRRVEFLRENNVWIENTWEDGSYVADMFAACNRYVAIPKAGYCYRAYSTPQQGIARNSGSSRYYLRPSYLRTLPHIYKQYKAICLRTNQPIAPIAARYCDSLCWIVGEYLPNSAGERDIHFRPAPISPSHQLSYLLELLQYPGVVELIADGQIENRLTKVVVQAVRSIMADCSPDELSQLCEKSPWLVGFTLAYERLKKGFSYDWKGIFDNYLHYVDHPDNLPGLGRTLGAILSAIQDDRWEDNPLLSQLVPLRKAGNPLVLYGAGAMGTNWLRLLSTLGIQPHRFLDRDKSGVLEGIPILSPQQFALEHPQEDLPILITLYSPDHQRQVSEMLAGLLPNVLLISFPIIISHLIMDLSEQIGLLTWLVTQGKERP